MHAINWSVAACLAVGMGMSGCFLFLEDSVAGKEEKVGKHKIIVKEQQSPLKSKEAVGSFHPVRASGSVSVRAGKEKLHKPDPLIGRLKFRKYLEENIIRPADDECKDVKGQVIVSFFVDKKGNPHRFVIIKSLCKWSDKEAIRLIKEGPKWEASILPAEVKVKF